MSQKELEEQLFINEFERVSSLFSSKFREGFKNKLNLAEWFCKTLIDQKYSCYYCETHILNIQKLIAQGKLKTRKIGYGVRGPVLEIDKYNNDQGYSPNNCVLACHYCNNDKSNIIDGLTYKTNFGKNREIFFKSLL